MSGQTEVAKLLLKQGANIKATDNEGYAPLHLASINGQTEVVKLLLNQGADIKATDNEKCTALHLACMNGQTKVAKILIDKMLSKNSKIEKPRFLNEHKELSPYWDYTKSKIGLLLKKLENKAKNLQDRGHTQAFNEAKRIVELLHNLNQDYFFTKKISYDNYQTNALDVIKQNRSELDKHRGYKKILGNLVIGIATLGAAQVLNKICSGSFLFFKQTSSSECLENLSNAIKNPPRPS